MLRRRNQTGQRCIILRDLPQFDTILSDRNRKGSRTHESRRALYMQTQCVPTADAHQSKETEIIRQFLASNNYQQDIQFDRLHYHTRHFLKRWCILCPIPLYRGILLKLKKLLFPVTVMVVLVHCLLPLRRENVVIELHLKPI